jgi:hypothetical protein
MVFKALILTSIHQELDKEQHVLQLTIDFLYLVNLTQLISLSRIYRHNFYNNNFNQSLEESNQEQTLSKKSLR